MKLLHGTKIDFLGKKWLALGLSAIFTVICIVYVALYGLHLGIDFAGGNLIHLKFQEAPKIKEIRQTLATVGYGKATLQADIQRNEVMIRVERATTEEGSNGAAQEQIVDRVLNALTSSENQKLTEEGKYDINLVGVERITGILMEKDPLGYQSEEDLPPTMTPQRYARTKYEPLAKALIDEYRESKDSGIFTQKDFDDALAALPVERNREAFEAALREATFLGSFSVIRTEMVSAVVGGELAEQALWAVIFSLGGILVYIWFRFNPRFSVAAIIATVHDTTCTVCIFTMVGREFNLPIVAAVLTIVGYSLNDTIVIFSRIRENLNIRRREAKEDYEGVLNDSINQTLSRTLLTSGTTLIVVVFLFFMGGSVINDFAFTMIIGIVVGTYSSIFVASPVLSIWQKITGTAGGALAKTQHAKVGR